LKIYHALKETSYLTDGASIADSLKIATTIFAPAGTRDFRPGYFAVIHCLHSSNQPASCPHTCGETDHAASESTRR
jgi:hypothetical protein